MPTSRVAASLVDRYARKSGVSAYEPLRSGSNPANSSSGRYTDDRNGMTGKARSMS